MRKIDLPITSKLVIIISISCIIISCTKPKNDFIIDTDDIREIVNFHNQEMIYEIDRKDYDRLVISSDLLLDGDISWIKIWEKEVLESKDGNRYEKTINVIPAKEGNYLVYELKDLPSKDLIVEYDIQMHPEMKDGAFLCMFEIDIK